MKNNISIIYEDSDIVVCHKLPGIAVQTARVGQQDMVSLLRNYFAEKKEDTQVFVVHRLDQPVEGVMVFARNQQAAAELSRQSREKTMDKYYLALVEGKFEKSSGMLEDYLLRDGKTNTSKVVPKGTKGAKAAKLFYQVQKVVTDPQKSAALTGKSADAQQSFDVEDGKGALSLVSIRLETGRHHQIRVQMAHAGMPLTGDRKYGGAIDTALGLCACSLTFLYPGSRKKMHFTVKPKGEAFKNFSL